MVSSVTQQRYSLTDEHRARLPEWRDRWIANALSTKAMDDEEREICRQAVLGLYAVAKLPPPKHIVFVPSPFVMRFAGGFAAAKWHRFHATATRAATDAATDAATYAATYAATRAATDAATDAATRAATDAATYAATDAATRAATRAATDAATGADLSQWYVCGLNDVQAWVRDVSPDPKFWWDCAFESWRMWQGGNQWSAYDSFLSFFKDVVGLNLAEYEAYQHWQVLAEHSGPRIVHPDFCMISDRPEVLLLDERNRPHCDTGPFCRWRDGSALYSVHGVRVPAWVIEQPEQLTADRVLSEANAEVRRVMIDRFGAERLMRESNALKVATDDWGTLWRLPIADDEDLVMVEVVNATAEPDGTWKHYWLRVRPTVKTPLEAVASTWRRTKDGPEITPDEYVQIRAHS